MLPKELAIVLGPLSKVVRRDQNVDRALFYILPKMSSLGYTIVLGTVVGFDIEAWGEASKLAAPVLKSRRTVMEKVSSAAKMIKEQTHGTITRCVDFASGEAFSFNDAKKAMT